MTLEEYEVAALKTRLPSATEEYVALGLVGEVGEFYGAWAKSIRDGKPWDETSMKKELGDILWFLTALSRDCGSSLAEIADMNIRKLSSRAKRKTLQGSGDNR